MRVLIVLLLVPRASGLLHPIMLLLRIIASGVVRLLAEPATACGQQHPAGTSGAPFVAAI